MIEYRPIPFSEWAEANPDLCSQTEECEVCEGSGWVGGDYCTCPDCGAEHVTPENKCDSCSGKGKVSLGKAAYAEQVVKDREKWLEASRKDTP